MSRNSAAKQTNRDSESSVDKLKLEAAKAIREKEPQMAIAAIEKALGLTLRDETRRYLEKLRTIAERLLVAVTTNNHPSSPPSSTTTDLMYVSSKKPKTNSLSYRDTIVRIYQTHNPSKLDSVDSLLEKYAGKEKKLISALRRKYKLNTENSAISSDRSTTSTSRVARTGSNDRSGKSVEGTKQNSTSLPAGFFDDKHADAEARDIDIVSIEKKRENREWESFKEFASFVDEEELKSAKISEVMNEQERNRMDVEQEKLRERVAFLKRLRERRARKSSDVKNDAHSSKPIAKIVSEFDGTGASLPALPDFAAMLREKKRRKKEYAEALAAVEIRPLDPTDWRSKVGTAAATPPSNVRSSTSTHTGHPV